MNPTKAKTLVQRAFVRSVRDAWGVLLTVFLVTTARGRALADDTYWYPLSNAYCDPNDPSAASFFDCIHWSNSPPCCCNANGVDRTCNTAGDPVCPATCTDCQDTAIFGSGLYEDENGPPPHTIHFGTFCAHRGGTCPHDDELAAGNATASYIVIQDDSWTFDLASGGDGCGPSNSDGGTLVLRNGFGVGFTRTSDGGFGDATLTLLNGGIAIQNEGATMGSGVGNQGRLVLQGPAAVLDASAQPGYVVTGNGGGNGLLEVRAGASVVAGYIGNGGYGGPNNELSSGEILVTGKGSIAKVIGVINVGSLTISDGAEGSTAHLVSGDVQDAYVGLSDGAIGHATVTGAGSWWHGIGFLTIGGVFHTPTNGHGIMEIAEGGRVSSSIGLLGDGGGGAVGDVLVDGAGSLWELGALRVGSLKDFGHLEVSHGGKIQVDGSMEVWKGSYARVSNGGKIAVGNTVVDPTPGSVELTTNGSLNGDGEVRGNVVNTSGAVRPGHDVDSTTTLTVMGNYQQSATGLLDVEIRGVLPSSRDRLAVSGVATLGGTLDVHFENFASPNPQTFEILTCSSRLGTFSAVHFIGLTRGRPTIEYGPNSVRVRVSPLGNAPAPQRSPGPGRP